MIAGDPSIHLFQLVPITSDELALATIDLADAERAQRRSELITPRADRRTDVYGLVVGDRRL